MFYYLFAGLDDERRTRLGLRGDVTMFHYLRGGTKQITKEEAIDIGLVLSLGDLAFSCLVACLVLPRFVSH